MEKVGFTSEMGVYDLCVLSPTLLLSLWIEV